MIMYLQSAKEQTFQRLETLKKIKKIINETQRAFYGVRIEQNNTIAWLYYIKINILILTLIV